MSAAFAQIERDALTLPAEERTALAESLYESVEESGLSPEWEEEIERRVQEIDGGRAKTIPHEQVMAELEARFGA